MLLWRREWRCLGCLGKFLVHTTEMPTAAGNDFADDGAGAAAFGAGLAGATVGLVLFLEKSALAVNIAII